MSTTRIGIADFWIDLTRPRLHRPTTDQPAQDGALMDEHPTTPPATPDPDEDLSVEQLTVLAAAIERGHIARLLDLLEHLVDDEDCRFDHHHNCQTHEYFALDPAEQCPMAAAKDALVAAGRDRGGDTDA